MPHQIWYVTATQRVPQSDDQPTECRNIDTVIAMLFVGFSVVSSYTDHIAQVSKDKDFNISANQFDGQKGRERNSSKLFHFWQKKGQNKSNTAHLNYKR